MKGLEEMVLTYESRLGWGTKKYLRQKSKQGEQVGGIRIWKESAVCVCVSCMKCSFVSRA